jgi:hypothetical protein
LPVLLPVTRSIALQAISSLCCSSPCLSYT